MKPIFEILILFFSISICLSCSKDDYYSRAATIKVVNLIEGVDNIIVKTGGNPIDYTTVTEGAKVSFKDSENFSIKEGISTEVIIVPENDILNTIYSESLNLKGVYSLYLSGTSEEVEEFLVEDNFKQFTDSIVGIRFINLSKSGLIDIGVKGETSYVVSGLPFNSISDYIEFPAQKDDGSYVFEFIDRSGSVRRTTFTVDPLEVDNISTKSNFTLVITDIVFQSIVFHEVIRFNNY